jgi:hypothetical protein
MKKHTPGPWEFHKNKSGIAILHPLINKEGDYKGKLGGYHVVIQERQLSPEGIETKLDEADARLIAAAPELLEACKMALDFVVDHDIKLKVISGLGIKLNEVITKVEG